MSKRRANTKKIDHTHVLSDPVKKHIEAARGVPLAKLWERIKAAAADINRDRQHFPELQTIEDKTLRGRVNDILRRHQEIPETVKHKALSMIRGLTEGLSKDGFGVYRMNIILADMVRDIDKGLIGDGRLPFGFETADDVRNAYDQYQHIAGENSEVADALQRRNEMVNDIKRRLVDAKLLKKKVMEDEDYFHHQVLQFWTDKYGLSIGSGDVRTRWRPWMVARKGSPLDYNTEYVEAEFMAVSQQRFIPTYVGNTPKKCFW